MNDRSQFLTEQRLPDSMQLDLMSVEEALAVMNAQDEAAVRAVASQRNQVAAAVRLVTAALRAGGRLLYFGAGTSGRLGVLDASECPPTFRTDPRQVQGVIAGGPDAMFRAKEGAEDSLEGAAGDVDRLEVNSNDVVMGIATGGTTPYVQSALKRAKQRGAKTIFFSCVQPFDGEEPADVVIRPLVGPEVLTGSTRLKAGTATKLALNQITTLTMVQLGKCYENLMVDLRASNSKLRERAIRIVGTITGVDASAAAELIDRAGRSVKVAITMHARDISKDAAETLLSQVSGSLRAALK